MLGRKKRITQSFINIYSFITSPSRDRIFISTLFLRALGITYFFAFVSLAIQVEGLIGSGGILPVSDTIATLLHRSGDSFLRSLALSPTLFHFNSSDLFILLLNCLGIALSLLIIFGGAHWVLFFLVFLIHISFTIVGGPFLHYFWDGLLCETGFISILVASNNRGTNIFEYRAPPNLGVFAVNWLLFRMMFSMGSVKFIANPQEWIANIPLLKFYPNQPMPAPFSWALWQLPEWFHKVSALMVFAFELAFPFFIFFRNKFKLIAFCGFNLFFVLMYFSGTYGYLHMLCFTLTLFLLDDFQDSKIFRLIKAIPAKINPIPSIKTSFVWPLIFLFLLPYSFLLITVSIINHSPDRAYNKHLINLYRFTSSYGIVNFYGLFGEIPDTRIEIELEASLNGIDWEPYVFKYKPTDEMSSPHMVNPNMSRLDHQMHYEGVRIMAIGNMKNSNLSGIGPIQSFIKNPWFYFLIKRLFHPTEQVAKLFSDYPLLNKKPKFIRIKTYKFKFTSLQELLNEGKWWVKNEHSGSYNNLILTEDNYLVKLKPTYSYLFEKNKNNDK